MSTNLIRNGSFTNSSQYWYQSGWYSGNTIVYLSNGGISGGCVKLTVPSEGDPGQSSIYQYVPLKTGESYTLTFYAKRSGSVDVWAEIYANGIRVNSSSYIPQLLTGGDYTQLSFNFTVPGTGSSTTVSRIRLIAGSAGGTAWFDSAEIQAEKIYLPSRYIETSAGARIYKNNYISNDNYGTFPENARFVYSGVSGDMVEVFWGQSSGTTTTAYIKKSDCWSSTESLDSDALSRMQTIATSLLGVKGVNLGLNGDYCEHFIHWLSAASNMSTSVYCGSGYCGDAVQYYINEGIYDVRGSSNFGILPGDIIYYDVTGYGTGGISAAHAGFVINANDETYYAIEGNVTVNGVTCIALVDGNISTGTNSVHSRTMHGAAHVFGAFG